MDTRVKHCAQARAIENECYVAIAVVLVTYQK
jgi:predicted amidohydrolase